MSMKLHWLLLLGATSVAPHYVFAEPEKKLILASPPNFLVIKISQNILTSAYNELGMDVEYKQFPTKRSLVQANSGAVDGEVSRIISIARDYPNLRRIPTPINYSELVGYSTHPLAIKSCAHLRQFHVGVVRGVKQAATCSKQARKVTIFDTADQMMAVLNKRRLDVALVARTTGIKYENNQNYPNLKLLQPALITSELYHYLHKSHSEMIEPLDQVIRTMAASGELNAIRSRTIEEHMKSAKE